MKPHQITLLGQSGCDVDIVWSADDTLVVRKTSSSASYDPRLMRQIQKQRAFNEQCSVAHVSAPQITHEGQIDGRCMFEMEHCPYDNVIRFLERASPSDVTLVAHRLMDVVDESISASKIELVDRKLVTDKCGNVCARVDTALTRAAAAKVKRLLPGHFELPIGRCHGDLTLSNVLFGTGAKLKLIDFLDVFIESPLNDIVKLRQDTAFGWSVAAYMKTIDEHRVRMLFDVMDVIVVDRAMKHDWYQRLYHPFQIVNFMRILPYCTDTWSVQWVTTRLEQLLSMD